MDGAGGGAGLGEEGPNRLHVVAHFMRTRRALWQLGDT